MNRNDICRFIVAGAFQISDIFKHLVHSRFIQVSEWVKGTLTNKIRIDIVTLAFGEIIRVVLLNQKSWTGGPNGIQFSTVFTTSLDWGATIAFASVIGTLVLLIVALQNFLRSTYGRAIMSVREDEIAANSNGISVFRYKMIGFVIASFIGGIGGALYAPLIGFVKPDLASFNNSVNHLIYVVLGGMGSVTGSIISAFVLTVLQEFLRFLRDYRLLIYPLILICMMAALPCRVGSA